MLDTARKVRPPCWLLRGGQVCFVHLGKYGDLMIMLPAFKAVAEELGSPPVCVVANDFASIFEGVSYVQPWPLPVHWWRGVKSARETAERAGFRPIVVKWWDEPGVAPPMNLAGGRTIRLKIHGQERVVPAEEWDSFQASQWRYAGFTMEQMMEWPLVFDRRSPEREEELRRHYMASGKPTILVNLSLSGTSPFKQANQVFSVLRYSGCNIVNLGAVRAYRIYDLLGLYDHAVALITSDTATLHLAAASNVPYIAFLNNGGAGSIPRGNCVLSIRYNQVTQRISDVAAALRRLAPTHQPVHA